MPFSSFSDSGHKQTRENVFAGPNHNFHDDLGPDARYGQDYQISSRSTLKITIIFNFALSYSKGREAYLIKFRRPSLRNIFKYIFLGGREAKNKKGNLQKNLVLILPVIICISEPICPIIFHLTDVGLSLSTPFKPISSNPTVTHRHFPFVFLR